jgi:hypothetical protein
MRGGENTVADWGFCDAYRLDCWMSCLCETETEDEREEGRARRMLLEMGGILDVMVFFANPSVEELPRYNWCVRGFNCYS